VKHTLLTIIFCFPFLLSALSVEKGNLKIVADDETGGYLCYSRLSEESPWSPLFVESYTSSYTQLKVNGEKILPGHSLEYTLNLEQTENSITVIYEGDLVRLTETVAILNDSRGTAYFSLLLHVDNLGDDTVEIGVKKVIDTAFKRGSTYFLIEGVSVEEETAFDQSNMPGTLLSPGTNPGEKLYVQTDLGLSTLPDRLLLVNWNRLDRESWDYTPSKGTNFNDLPFSLDDSALGLFWMPLALKRGKSHEIGLALGPHDFTLKEESLPGEGETNIAVLSADPALARLHIEEQLTYIDQLLSDLDGLIEKGVFVSNDEILSLENRLEMLEREKGEYEKIR
jgi:hypothetical protein